MSGSSPTHPDNQPDAPPPRAGLFGRRMLQTPREALQPEDAPPPPPPPVRKKRRRPTLSALSGFLTFLLMLFVAGIGGLALMQTQLRTPGPLATEKVVVIAPRTDVQEILTQLETEGVIEHPLLLNLALLMEGNRSRVKAGEYLFKQNASLRDVIDTLVSGKEILHSITIPEGLTSEQIVQRLLDNELLTGAVRDVPKEGTLLPETYRVARGMARNDLLRKMQDDQKRVLDQVWARRHGDTPLRSPYELVTLASIVEKETGKADERPRVAGVFLNRLQRRMKLQSDPTIVYGLVGGKGTLGRGILRSELEQPTPYNTYVIEGLPPGPIANPGRAALEAVVNPSRTKDLYFVADGSGGHTFAETLDQHNRNVMRWRQVEKDMREKQGPAATVDQLVPDALAPSSGGGPGATNPPAPRAPRGTRGDLGSDGVTTATTSTPDAAAAASAQARAGQQSQSRFAGMSFAPKGMDELFAPPATSRSLLDGPADEPAPAPGALQSYPMNARRAEELRARAARLGLPAGESGFPTEDEAPAQPVPAVPRVVRIYDASEGTALDPLRNKSWDLNSAKTIPDMPPLDGAQPGAGPAAKPAARVAQQPAARAKTVHKPAARSHAKPASKPKPAPAPAE